MQSVRPIIEIQWRLTAPPGRARLHTLSLADLYCGLVIDGGGAHSLFDLASHCQKGLFDIRGVLGGCLQKWDTQTISKFL